VAGKDRDVVRRYERVWSSFDAGTCRSDQGGRFSLNKVGDVMHLF
jgi:hypothetical protein